ncbi:MULTISPECIES: MFS transporter [unclassified Janthinobacterium]|uniref:MFS transporter n=1 Tax=unclassified Janthinobacterium TaxID=2610881 RepID=UPI00161B2471|nr:MULTISPECIES: MFS transporter [unclassified Janthinobacterium]MBB5369280.1 sugar phosphate permease [Janthinobacterium sp. K2C7]MBB5381184.1 sugar phosphate permease [Janthinobacterium sp. K2Li3]MBB5387663.1 sugar phosphate permease [Janthinobacterium sp. K2E3]
MAPIQGAATATDQVREGAYRKVTLHLIPFIFICYLFNYLDRVNVGFAKLQMLDALQWSESVYGLGAGIFFIGYVASGVPSNLLLHKLGARKVIGTLMIAWGIASACLMFVTTPSAFYILRFITGMFEAGFFPGIVLYFTNWYPASRRGRIMGLFMSAIPISGLLGSPLSGWMMEFFADHHGLAGWQWMFLLQGIPTVVLGLLVYVLLNDGIPQAKWLSTEEKRLLLADLDDDERQRRAGVGTVDSFASVLKNGQVWMLGLVYFCIQMGVYAINFWLPTIVKSLGYASPVTVGWISAIPYLCASIFMIWVGRSADRHKERRWHLSGPLLMALCGLMLATQAHGNVVIAIIGLSLATMGVLSGLPMFWPLPTAFLGSAAAAGGLALINSLGQIAGFVSPFLVGWIKDATGSTDVALYILSAVLLLGAMLVLRVPAKTVNR